MEIEGFDNIIDTIKLAKELHDVGRFDIVQSHFSDVLSWDSYYESMLGAIGAAFSGYYNDYIDEDDSEIMIFTDDVISEYYRFAWEYGRSHNVPHSENPFVIEAERAADRLLSYCYSLGWKLLGYTKTKRTAAQSKLIVYSSPCECCSFDRLAYGLVMLHQFFAEKCEEFNARMSVLPTLADSSNTKAKRSITPQEGALAA